MQHNNRKFLILISLFTIVQSLSVDASNYLSKQDDLLAGNGLFNQQSLGAFTSDTSHVAKFVLVNSSNILKLQKPSTSDIGFSTGLDHSFVSSTPKHVTFQFSSISTQTEDANLRLMDSTSGSTVLLFRAGKAGLIRVNQNQMVEFYNNSVSTDANIKSVKIDLLLDWENKKIDIFVGQVWKGQSKFFQQVLSVNKLRLYNLYQSTSYWKNIAVCSSNCYSFIYEQYLATITSLIALSLILIFN